MKSAHEFSDLFHLSDLSFCYLDVGPADMVNEAFLDDAVGADGSRAASCHHSF